MVLDSLSVRNSAPSPERQSLMNQSTQLPEASVVPSGEEARQFTQLVRVQTSEPSCVRHIFKFASPAQLPDASVVPSGERIMAFRLSLWTEWRDPSATRHNLMVESWLPDASMLSSRETRREWTSPL